MDARASASSPRRFAQAYPGRQCHQPLCSGPVIIDWHHDAWITAIEAGDQPDLHSFVRGIKRDYDAVLNGLTMPWTSGVVEGNVNRLKMLKRQTFGRAAFPLLRKRVLLVS